MEEPHYEQIYERGIKAMENRYYFRAKRIDNDEWVHGLPSCNKDGEIGEIEVWDGEDITFYTVDPSTICQCTGLRDKNDKLIWEKRYPDGIFVRGSSGRCYIRKDRVERIRLGHT